MMRLRRVNSGRPIVNARKLLGLLCEAAPGLRTACPDEYRDLLEDLLAAAGRGEPVEEMLETLELREFILQEENPRSILHADDMVDLLGAGSGHPVTGVYRCPGAKCSRRVEPLPGQGRPHCSIRGQDLDFERY
jgi:hypothetical protein